MHTIEITTAQNVVIQFTLASIIERIIAFVVDFIIIIICFSILVFILLGIFDESDSIYIFTTMVLSFYSLIFERFLNGQSLGKMLVGIKVIKVDGGQPEGVALFKRWSLRLLDIYLSLGSLGIISVASSEKGQRLGDKVADTMVIKVEKGTKHRLESISKLTRSEEYEPIYPEAKKLDEQYVLQLKQLVIRHRKSKSSEAYQNLANETAELLENTLGISRQKSPAILFIQQVVKDYVILTR